jgi:hypothetical protein
VVIVIFATNQKGELIILSTEEIRHWYNNKSNMFWCFDKQPETEMIDYDIATQDEIDNALILRKLNNELYQEWLYQKWILSELDNHDPFGNNEREEKNDKVLLEIKRTFKQKNMIKIVKDVNLGLIINER